MSGPSSRMNQKPTSPRWLDDLLADPVTEKVIGKQASVYCAKWRRCFDYLDTSDELRWYTLPFSSGGLARRFTWTNLKSLIWPAIFGPYWFAYRKLYVPAVVISIISLLSARLPARWIIPVVCTTLVLLLHYAPAIYLCHVRDVVRRQKNSSSQDKEPSDLSQQPTSWIALGICVAAYAAVSFGFEAFSASAPTEGVTTCKSPRVKTLVLDGTFTEPRDLALKKIANGDVTLIATSIDPRSIKVDIRNIRQISYDPNNASRRCVADYVVDAPLKKETAAWLATMGTSPNKLVSLFVQGWRSNGVQFSICNGEIYYTIQKTLDGGADNERIGWRCVPNN